MLDFTSAVSFDSWACRIPVELTCQISVEMLGMTLDVRSEIRCQI